MSYKVLINDGMDKEGLNIFEKENIQYINEYREGNNLLETIGEFDAFLVRSKTKVTKEIIEAGTNGKLRIIGRGGVGVDNIDVKSASEHGIVVKFAPNRVTNATAEHTIGLLFSIARKIPQSDFSLKSGFWKKKSLSGIELEGKTLGLIGCGRIGQRVAEKARALGMNVIGYDSNISYLKENFPDSVIEYTDLDNLLTESNVISLHTGGKQQIIGENELSKMKENAILINASRGNNVNEEALYKALSSKKLYGAAIDSYKNEPKNEDQETTESMKKLATLENVVMTSHLGASTNEGQRKTSIELARVTADYLLNGSYSNSVNTIKPSEELSSIYTICIYHKDIPGMFGQMTQILGNNGINIRDMKSEQIAENGKVITNCLVHQQVNEETLRRLRSIIGVQRVLFS
ncbi:MAG TPA: NAD(P)-dependent oxidoreductase [Candidatus Paceibacterota bacterium]|nr:NAD(P)-dependent oxidoreductase [Candidatus Paceibacterota bacterium]